MMMTPDDLRALADALPEGVHWSDPITPDMLAEAIRRFCADAQPVAWMYEHDGCVDTPLFTVNRWTKCEEPWNESPLFLHPAPAAPHYAMLDSHRRLVERAIEDAEHPSGMSTHDGKARIDASILRRMLAIIDSLPVAPQAEPKHELTADERDMIGSALHSSVRLAARRGWRAEAKPASGDDLNIYREIANGYRNDTQAEPKREDQPLRDLLAIIHRDGGHHTAAVGIEQSIKDAQAAVYELKRELAMEKREPLTYEQLVSACYTYSHNFGLLDPDEQEIVIEEAGRWAKALGIGGTDDH